MLNINVDIDEDYCTIGRSMEGLAAIATLVPATSLPDRNLHSRRKGDARAEKETGFTG
ncbi:hypothetical protein [Bradyrhizobium sp. 141]|uniref:hypothetical protein n=1 Tax=Bradyrhizobium sp. 141 TaxID=2782617 RepID=UPI001FF7F026|nr:hypothetical protein [Bradyrhizobium sp. 141]MCK1721272.1 hypothetical protein [Bradyrhizobium sp. 141]